MEQPTDMSQESEHFDPTRSSIWLRKQTTRLEGWEVLQLLWFDREQSNLGPLQDICDRIGGNKTRMKEIYSNIKKKKNAQF